MSVCILQLFNGLRKLSQQGVRSNKTREKQQKYVVIGITLWSIVCNTLMPASYLAQLCSCNISDTRDSVSSYFQTLKRELKTRLAAEYFLTIFEVFVNVMKHCLEC